MTEIENQWKVVQDHIRLFASGAPEAFGFLPASGPELEAVYLLACAAELKRYKITFRRRVPLHMDVENAPEELTWRMRLDNQSGRSFWNVDGLGLAFSSGELAQAILKQLNEYCKGYERELQSFFD